MKDDTPKVKTMPRCPLSLRPDERVIHAYVLGQPYAIAIVNAWKPKFAVVQANAEEWGKMQLCYVVFGGVA